MPIPVVNFIRFSQAILFILLSSFSLDAQSYLSRTYNVSDGIASSSVYSITQDIKGKMWFATSKGVSSYSGAAWSNYSQVDGLLDKEYRFVMSDIVGNIWALTRSLDDGVSFFNGIRWIHQDGPESLPAGTRTLITSVDILANSIGIHIAVGTEKNGLYVLNTKHSQWIHASEGQAGKNSGGQIYSIATLDDAFIVSSKQGLFTIDPLLPREWIPLKVDIPSYPVFSVCIDKKVNSEDIRFSEDRVWLGGEKWFGYFHPEEKKFHSFYRGDLPGFKRLYYYQRMSIHPDMFGGLWVATEASLCNIGANGEYKYLGKQNLFAGEGAFAIFYDREYNLWMANFRGVSKIVSFQFENYSKKIGLYDDEVSAVCELGDDKMVFGHNTGFTIYDGKKFKQIPFPLDENSVALNLRVLDMCRDRQGNVWAACTDAGIARISPTMDIKWFHVVLPFKKDAYYSSVVLDNLGNIIASINSLFYKFDHGRGGFFPIIPNNTLNSDNFRKLFVDRFNKSEQTIYAPTMQTSVYLFKDSSLTELVPIKKENEIMVFAVYPARDGSIWVGANTGLFVLKDRTLVRHQHPRLEITSPVYFITEDEKNKVWIGLSNGVILWDGINARHFTPTDGLIGNETNRSAGYVDKKGRMWIGTDMGISCYDKNKDIKPRVPPIIELLYVNASGFRFSLGNDIFLENIQNDLSFFFIGNSFIDETALKYNLKLEGFDSHWTTDFKSPNNQIRYTNIPPGTYRFHIQAVNCLGIESEIVSSQKIVIKKGFFKSLTFYLIIAGIVILFVILTVNFISKRGYAARLEKQYQHRTQQLESSERELRYIFNMAHDAIIIFNPDDEIVLDVNQRACDMYGFSRPEFIGLSLITLSKDTGHGKVKIVEALQRGDYISFETVQFRKDGSEMILEINATVINFRGKTAILSLNRDITERKQSEERIKQSLQEKEILLKEIHHRVKNNLQVILSLLDLQADKLESPDVLSVFQDSKNRIRSMALVHENLYQSGNLARINTAEYMQSVVNYFLATYGNLGDRISYNVEIDSIMLDMDTAIPVGLILTELISNALKHAFKSGQHGQLTISFRPELEGSLTLLVRDNGVGIPEEENLRKSKSLGLQLVTLLTRQLKGKLDIIRCEGTMFKVTFPFMSPEKKNQLPLEKNHNRE